MVLLDKKKKKMKKQTSLASIVLAYWKELYSNLLVVKHVTIELQRLLEETSSYYIQAVFKVTTKSML